jgi:hypothetical protein
MAIEIATSVFRSLDLFAPPGFDRPASGYLPEDE